MATTGSHPKNAMTVLTRQDNIVAWYRPVQASGPRDIAQEAYTDAVEYLKRELSGNEKSRKWLDAHTSFADVRAIVDKARREYEAKTEKRKDVHTWLNKLSSRIIFYSQTLDMLAQHHPEYVALAWGALKFVLTGIINHATLVVQLATALTDISEVLPRIELNAQLYQTDHMKEAISRLYAHIMLFFQQAVKWYNLGPAGRALSSIFKPFELDYKDTVEQIKLCSATVTEIANAAAGAEIRDINITVQIIERTFKERERKLDDAYGKLHEMQIELKDKQMAIDGQVDRVLKIVTTNKALTEHVQLDIQDMKPRICDIQMAHILDVLSPRISPEDTLHKCRSLKARRRQTWKSSPRDTVDLLKMLGHWVAVDGSSLFIIRAGPRAESKAKDFAIDVINHLQSTPYKTFWTLSPPGSSDHAVSTTSVLRSLVFQALRHDPGLLLNNTDQLNITRFRTDHTETEWMDLLCLLFTKLSKCFVVVETEDLFQTFRHDPEWAKDFLQIFQHIVDTAASSGSQVKILVVSFGNFNSTLANMPAKSNRISTMMAAPAIVPARTRRRGQARGRGSGWRSLRSRF